MRSRLEYSNFKLNFFEILQCISSYVFRTQFKFSFMTFPVAMALELVKYVPVMLFDEPTRCVSFRFIVHMYLYCNTVLINMHFVRT